MSALAYKQINAPGLSQNGKIWLTRALDPFHDVVNLPPAGLPDESPYPTIVKEHTRAVPIKAPASVTGSATWSCAIFTMPTLNQTLMQKTKEYSNGNMQIDAAGQDTAVFGTVTAVAWPEASGPDWFNPTVLSDFATGSEFYSIGVNPQVTTSFGHSLSRLVGGGFEVCNTTNPLNVQGKCTIANIPQIESRDMVPQLSDADSTTTSTSPIFRYRLPASTVEQVRAMPNSVTWHAEEGCYVPFRMDHCKNPFTIDHNLPVVFSIPAPLTDSGTTSTCLSSDMADLASTSLPIVTNKWHHTPISSSVAIFSGLSASSTLDLNVKFLEEIAPVTDLSLLAFGPKMYHADPLALRLYQESICLLPVGVYFSDNASAQFWSKAVDVVSKIASPLVGAAFGPAAGTAVALGGKAISEIIKKKAEKTDKKIEQVKQQLSNLSAAQVATKKGKKK